VVGVGSCETLLDRGAKGIEGGIVVRIEALLAHKAPEALNQVEVGRIGGQIEQFDAERGRVLLHQHRTLIAHIIQNHGDRQSIPTGCQFRQELTHRIGRHGGSIDHGNELFGEGIHGSQDIQAVPTGWRGEEQPGEAPEPA